MIKLFNRIALNSLLVILLMYFAIFGAWYAAYSNYFFFPMVYQMEDIHGHVMEFAPQNRNGKADFVYVAPSFHLTIFYQMLRAIDNEGEGLSEITYPAKDGEKKFLTTDEQVHLQDVADLISFLKSFSPLFIVLLGCVMLAMIFGAVWPYYTWRMFRGLMLVVALFGAVLYFTGFTSIFYGMHTLVFPEGHKWFFYYQESLMSTMLKAPDSFAVFGVILGVFALIALLILYWGVSMLVRTIIKSRGV